MRFASAHLIERAVENQPIETWRGYPVLDQTRTYVGGVSERIPIPVPIPNELKDLPAICCSDPDCREIAPFTARQWEEDSSEAQLAVGWQLRLIVTNLIADQGPAQEVRWDFYCPKHSSD